MPDTVNYTLKRSARARYMRLAIYPNGSCVVTVPFGVSTRRIESFIRDHMPWIREKIDHARAHPVAAAPRYTRKHYTAYKEHARTFALQRLAFFNQIYDFPIARVAIRDQKRGNLNFNYKIVLLPQHLADYVIVHELCHLGAFDHSKKFWHLVAKMIPDHKALRKELRVFSRDRQ